MNKEKMVAMLIMTVLFSLIGGPIASLVHYYATPTQKDTLYKLFT